MEQVSETSPSPARAPEDTYVPSMFSLRGRIGRLRYLAYSGVVFMLGFIYAAYCIYNSFDLTVSGSTKGVAGQAILISLGVPFFILHTGAHIVFAWRRFEDAGNSGWLAFLTLVPAVSLFVGLYLMFRPGSVGRNQYGPAPAANTFSIVVAGIGLPIALILAILAFIGFMLATFFAGVR